MVFQTILQVSFVLLAVGLITFKQKIYLKLCAILSMLIVALLILLMMILDNDFNYSLIAYNDILNFKFPVFATTIIFGISFIISMLFLLLHTKINYKELAAILLYFIGAIGVISAKEIFNLILYWEMIALAGSVIVAFSNYPNAQKIALRYFTMHAISGICLVIALLDYAITFSTNILPNSTFSLNDTMNYFLLFAILINLGLPPFGSWIVDGYSKCSHNASLFLSVFTTKSALLLLLKFFYGTEHLLYIGIFIGFYGLCFSVFQNNIRKILAYSIIHQIGIAIIGIATLTSNYGLIIAFIMVGVLYKLAFFMIAAFLYDMTKSENIYKLRHTINIKSLLGVILIIIALQSLGLPLTGGFIVKSYLLSDIESLHLNWLDNVMLFLTAGSALNVGVRLPYFLLNFKNTSSMTFKHHGLHVRMVLPLLLILVLLQVIAFVYFYSFTTIANVFHAFEIILIGLILFYASYKAFDETVVLDFIDNIINKIKHSTLYLLRLLNTTFILDTLNTHLVNTYNGLLNKQFKVDKLTSSRMVYVILIFTCLLYLVIKLYS